MFDFKSEEKLCGVKNPRTGMVCDLPVSLHDRVRGPFGLYTNGRHRTMLDNESYDWYEKEE